VSRVVKNKTLLDQFKEQPDVSVWY